VSGWRGFAVWFWGRPVLRPFVIETQIRELPLPKSRYVVEVTPPQLLYRCTDASWNSRITHRQPFRCFSKPVENSGIRRRKSRRGCWMRDLNTSGLERTHISFVANQLTRERPQALAML
jgi:hypothetical protein